MSWCEEQEEQEQKERQGEGAPQRGRPTGHPPPSPLPFPRRGLTHESVRRPKRLSKPRHTCSVKCLCSSLLVVKGPQVQVSAGVIDGCLPPTVLHACRCAGVALQAVSQGPWNHPALLGVCSSTLPASPPVRQRAWREGYAQH